MLPYGVKPNLENVRANLALSGERGHQILQGLPCRTQFKEKGGKTERTADAGPLISIKQNLMRWEGATVEWQGWVLSNKEKLLYFNSSRLVIFIAFRGPQFTHLFT